MKEMLGYQVNEVAAALRMPLSFDPTTLIEIVVYSKNLKPFGIKMFSTTQLLPNIMLRDLFSLIDSYC